MSHKEVTSMKEMLNYYNCETLEQFADKFGLNNVDAERLLKEMYEEDVLWD